MIRGLMDGLIIQAKNMGDYYSIESEVFDKVVKALEEFDKKEAKEDCKMDKADKVINLLEEEGEIPKKHNER